MVINRFIFHFAFIVLFQGFVFGLGDNQHIGAELSTEDVVNSSQISFNYTDNDPLLDQSKSTIVSEDLIRAYSFSESLTVTNIPAEYQQYLYVDFVDLAASTLSDRIIIKGFNKLKGRVYVNDHQVPCDQNGFFSYNYELTNLGKQVIYVTFTTLDNKFITLEKKLNYLYEPEFLLKNVELKRDVTYFYNSNLFYSIKDKSTDDVVTRADLAYFLMILSNSNYDIQTVLYVVNDVFEEDWYYDAVNYVLHNQLKGVKEFLNWCKDQSISMAVCTNKQEYLSNDLLKKIGIYDYFEYVAGSDTFDYCKPDPRHLTSVVEILDGDIKKSIMIGDSETDANAAKAAEIPIILLEDGYTEKNKDEIYHNHLIKDFTGIEKIISEYL